MTRFGADDALRDAGCSGRAIVLLRVHACARGSNRDAGSDRRAHGHPEIR
jgi:hypothetical protein